MMFINKKDSLRRDFNLGMKSAENCVKRNCKNFCIPMPSMSETIWKIKEKEQSNLSEIVDEVDRLFRSEFFTIRYINNPVETYRLASEISKGEDSRDLISPMDALIVATAITDQDCTSFYTSDSKLITDFRLEEIIDEWREQNDFPNLRILSIESVLSKR